MQMVDFERIVARLEQESLSAPTAYKLKVGLLALVGFGLIAVLMSFAGLGLIALAGLALFLLTSGVGAIVVLLKLGKLLVLLAIPLWFLVKSSLSALFKRLPAPTGTPLTRADAPALFDALDEMRRRMRGPRFHQVLLVEDMNAAVVQRPLFGLFGFPRNYLLLGLPLLESMSAEEALAVVAHEYGHLAGSHSRFAAYIYRMRLSWGNIQAITEQWRGWTGRQLRKPVDAFAAYFNAYTFVLARANEYQADAASAELVGTAAAVSALKRVNVSGGAYERFMEATIKTTRSSDVPPRDLAEQWARTALVPPPRELVQKDLDAALRRAPHAADTHPSLKQRLAALGVDEAGMALAPDALTRQSAAQAWLGESAVGHRRAFQERWRSLVSDNWREQFQHWSQKRERVAAIQAMPERGADEDAELLHLTLQLQPDEDHLPALIDFNARHPDHAHGLFLEGSQRLDKDDESGLPLLERAMALDADAVRAGCERAFAFLSSRQDPRAKDYADRWNRRADWEATREQQLGVLAADSEVRPVDLPAQTLARMRELLAQVKPSVSQCWIARRVIPADPDAEVYVMVLRGDRWTRMRAKEGEIIQAAVRLDWPLPGHFCTDGAPYAALSKRVVKTGLALL
jgi:Zn-dependent protease with chaperone function